MGIAALQLAHMQLAEKAYPAITQTFTQVMTSTTIERSPWSTHWYNQTEPQQNFRVANRKVNQK